MALQSPASARSRSRTPASSKVASVDPIWTRLREEADAVLAEEPALSAMVLTDILNEKSLEGAVGSRVAQRLDHPDVPANLIRQAFMEAAEADERIGRALRADIVATRERDPACSRYIEPVLFFKGYQALAVHRMANWLWNSGRKDFAMYLQSRASSQFGTDIHPAARIGKGIMLDHATGIVIGETAVVEDEVSILHAVTLGGSGKESGDRHPKVRRGVLLGAGAKVLGNIEIGESSRVASGSVVLEDVPPCKTVAGVPARIVGEAGCNQPALSMDHRLRGDTPDFLGADI